MIEPPVESASVIRAIASAGIVRRSSASAGLSGTRVCLFLLGWVWVVRLSRLAPLFGFFVGLGRLGFGRLCLALIGLGFEFGPPSQGGRGKGRAAETRCVQVQRKA